MNRRLHFFAFEFDSFERVVLRDYNVLVAIVGLAAVKRVVRHLIEDPQHDVSDQEVGNRKGH